MGKRRTPEQQNALIKRMTSQWPVAPLLVPRGRVRPYLCEHCEEVMTDTGGLPSLKDQESWKHWIGWSVGEHGVQKVHSRYVGADYGFCCVDCFKTFQQWQKDNHAAWGE